MLERAEQLRQSLHDAFMSETISQKKLDAAVDFGFLDRVQIETLENERRESGRSVLEIAVAKGLLNRKQLDILNISADPEGIVPGYRIDGFLGEGGVGTVYKATQIRMDRPVAIKTIQRSAARNDLTLKRFEQEARIIGQLRHPNIISAFDFDVHEEKFYLIMEFVDGIDAAKVLSQNSRVPERHAWFIARQVCHALHNAKQVGIIHRDIKPGNLIFTESPAGTPMPTGVPFVKVADFGLAKFSDRKMNAKLTAESKVSVAPLSTCRPSRFSRWILTIEAISIRLAATIWHLISGSPPVSGESPLDVITNKMNLEDAWLEPIGEISEPGGRLLAKMCRHDREKRIDDYAELSREIDVVIDSLAEPESKEISETVITAGSSRTANITTIREMAKTFAPDPAVDGGDSQDFELGDQGFSSNSSTETGTFSTTTDAGLSQESMPTIESIHQPNHRGRSSALWSIVVVFGLLLIAAMSIANNFNNDLRSLSSTQTAGPDQSRLRLEAFNGSPIHLFDGTQPDPTQNSRGTWKAARKDDDGGEEVVLIGLGTREFRCCDLNGNSLRNFRFVSGFRHHQADVIKFKLLNVNSESESEPENEDENGKELFRVIIEPGMAILVSGKTRHERKIRQSDADENLDHHQFHVESQPGYWRIEVDRELLGEVDKPQGYAGEDEMIQLSIEGKGSAQFDGISLQEFADEPDEQKM